MPKSRFRRERKPRPTRAVAPSKMSGKQRLARMGKRLKRGEMAQSADYLTRTQAVKRLQLTLRDFRRLCILKGIFPRVPPKQTKGQNQTYYHVKDIGFLAHEPVLQRFRDLRAFMKKVRAAAGKGQLTEARRLASMRPGYRLDHLVRERYPRFQDALADLDDALSMAHLFATLPAEGAVRPERVAVAGRLCKEWQHYCVRSHCLRKAFISVKGIYFQAEVHGTPVTWVVPHRFALPPADDVDYRIMLTFFEFHETLLGFVMFKLYHDMGLRYPPQLLAAQEDAGAHLSAVRAAALADGEGEDADEDADEGTTASGGGRKRTRADGEEAASAQGAVDALLAAMGGRGQGAGGGPDDEDDGSDAGHSAGGASAAEDDEDDEDEDAMLARLFGSGDDEATRRAREAALAQRRAARLFRGLVVFLNREVPREVTEFLILAFGGRVGWDGPASPFAADDPRITHHVVDRPLLGARVPGREYVQPQWLFDSANNQTLLPVARYAPGAKLPPHLSPFIDDAAEGYVPAYREELDQLTGAAAGRARDAADDGEAGGEDQDEEDEDDDEEGDDYAAEVAAEAAGAGESSDEEDDEEDDDDDEDDDEDDDDDDDDEDEDEDAAAKNANLRRLERSRAKRAESERREKEAMDLRATLLSNKKRRAYNVVQRSIRRSKAWVSRLEEKRAAIEAKEAADAKAQKKRKPAKRDRGKK